MILLQRRFAGLLVSKLLLLSSHRGAVVSGELLSTGQDVDEFVEYHIAFYDVMVFAKSYCRYSKHTRKILEVRRIV